MGACNGYRYYELRHDWTYGDVRPLVWSHSTPFIPDYPEREADEKMLAEIAAKPEEWEMY